MRQRYPRWVYSRGSEPDPRFSLANERTFLAWIRTSLALVAAGVGLEALDVPIPSELRVPSAAVFILLGLLAVSQGWMGWMRTERALRENHALPSPTLGSLLAAGVVLAVGLVAIGFLL